MELSLIRITYSRTFEKQLKRVPKYIQDKVELWIWTIEDAGLRIIQRAPGLHDEPLQGKRWGQRSIRLNKAYRLIYRVIKDEVHIEL
ncbi:type II toxin-antitoxin system RelE family toxin [Bdellovibrio sp. HCB185ZH]|uniref:type II toxin-antitoxin system RelE family toxin n=1 Tax=Bdellovibrio sp. HCB185ZH TaxID=3394235 RepID=UPI0039A5D114